VLPGRYPKRINLLAGIQLSTTFQLRLALPARFASGRPVWIRFSGVPNFDPKETVRRARPRLGEDRYRLLTNNCEHFCEWCLRGRPRSHQVVALLTQPGRALRALLGLHTGSKPRCHGSLRNA